MFSTFSIDNETQMKDWDRFVLGHPNGTPFHLSGWLQCIHKTYHYKPLLYVSLKQTNGHETHIDGVFPFFHVKSLLTGSRLVSIPFSDYGGPLFDEGSKGYVLLSNLIQNFNGKYRYLEIRSHLKSNPPLIPHYNFIRHTLSLNSQPEMVKRNFNKRTTLYSIRKAENEGITIREDGTPKCIKIFQDLNTLTRKKHGLPPQPLMFIQNIYNYLILNKYASMLLAVSGSRVIAAGLFLKFRDTTYYKYNASDPDFTHQTKSNHLLAWHAIKKACEEGFRYFDFGRTAVSNHGLSKYKENWGAQPMDLPYHFFPDIHGATSVDENALVYRMFNMFCKKLPTILLRQLGEKLYKHIG